MGPRPNVANLLRAGVRRAQNSFESFVRTLQRSFQFLHIYLDASAQAPGHDLDALPACLHNIGCALAEQDVRAADAMRGFCTQTCLKPHGQSPQAPCVGDLDSAEIFAGVMVPWLFLVLGLRGHKLI